MLIAQISDFHVVPDNSDMGQLMRTTTFLKAAVAHVLAVGADVVIGTGDLVDTGTREEYELLESILRPIGVPLFLIPGNHDNRDILREVLRPKGHEYLPEQGFLHYTHHFGDLRLLALDTVVPKESGGLLCQERLAWLDARLCEDATPTIIMQHHPPFTTGMKRMDDCGLANMAEQAAVIAKHPHVERILCGHLHRNIVHRVGGTIASTCSSTAHAVELDLAKDGRLAVLAEPPACTLHLWRDGSLVSHHSYIGDYGPAYVIQE